MVWRLSSVHVLCFLCATDIVDYFFIAEWKKIQTSAHDHFQRIFNDHEKLKSQLESHKKELELRGEELEKREARNETERKKLSEEISEVLCFPA